MEIDTEAKASIGSHELWRRLGNISLTPAPHLRAYGGSAVPAMGKCYVNIEYKAQRRL